MNERTPTTAQPAPRNTLLLGTVVVLATLLLFGLWSMVRGEASAVPPPDLHSDLLLEYSISVTPISPTESYTPGVSRDEAIAIAVDELPIAEGRPGAASLVFFTDGQYGPDAGHTGTVSSLHYQNRPAWLIAFPAVEISILGRWQGEASPISGETINSTYTATLVVFIDATTGDFLEAVTV
jgi:hypothetical protein